MKKSKEEIKNLVKRACELRAEGTSVIQISFQLGISITAASNYSRGYVSSRRAKEDYERICKGFRERLVSKLGELRYLGYPIQSFNACKIVTIKFKEGRLPTVVVRRDLASNVVENTSRVKLERLLDEIVVQYKDGKYFLKPKTFEAKAYVNEYVKSVLAREVV